jgi:hypothetical protein
MPLPHAYADCGHMNNSWYVTQELASAHRRDLGDLRGRTYPRRQPHQFHLPHFGVRFHRSPKAATRHAWQ